MAVIYREKKYYCGNYTEIEIYPVYPMPRGRGKKKKPSSAAQERLNEKKAVKKLDRLIKVNADELKYEVTLTYTDMLRPSGLEQASKELQNYLRRLKYAYRRCGAELKYIAVTEVGERSGNIHFHLILNECAGTDTRGIIERAWKMGYANTKTILYDKDGCAGLVYYITKGRLNEKGTRERPTYRRWSCSKNLKKPKESQNDSKLTYGRCKKLFKARFCAEEFKAVYPKFEQSFGKFDIAAIGAEHIANEFKENEVAAICAEQNNVNGEFYINIKLYKRNMRFNEFLKRRE